ncbi:hypothetical protein [Sphingomonas sp.]|jgi:hypothetical protein|uniref:hypothetical protein n=1 Tax=Sphingomonas sp. TaxID=28214 RepID=UPI003566C6A4
MKLFLISQNQNYDYDTYDSAVVAAPDEETARLMNPRNGMTHIHLGATALSMWK